MRCRAATSSISIWPTTSIFWSRTSTRGSSPAWSKASAGPKLHGGGRQGARREASRSALVKSGAASAAEAATASHTGAIAGDDRSSTPHAGIWRHTVPDARRSHRGPASPSRPGRLPRGKSHRHRRLLRRRQGPAARLRQRRRRGSWRRSRPRPRHSCAAHRSRPAAGKSARCRRRHRRAGDRTSARSATSCAPIPTSISYHPGPLPGQSGRSLSIRRRCAASWRRPTNPFSPLGGRPRTSPMLSRTFQSEAGVPFIQGLPETVRGAAKPGALRRERSARGICRCRAPRGRAERSCRPAFDALLAAHGLPAPKQRACGPRRAEAAVQRRRRSAFRWR